MVGRVVTEWVLAAMTLAREVVPMAARHGSHLLQPLRREIGAVDSSSRVGNANGKQCLRHPGDAEGGPH